jgi:hypothetical protein
MAATGGMNIATTLMMMAAVIEKNLTTNQALTMSVRQMPMSRKYRRRRSTIRSYGGGTVTARCRTL